jgi:hypothetical protein
MRFAGATWPDERSLVVRVESPSLVSAQVITGLPSNPTRIGVAAHDEVFEVTVLTGESNFLATQHFNTALGTVCSNWTFDAVDYNGDGKLDLFGIEKSGGATGTTEVHVLTGAESSPGVRFQTFLLHTGTGLHITGDEFDFHG